MSASITGHPTVTVAFCDALLITSCFCYARAAGAEVYVSSLQSCRAFALTTPLCRRRSSGMRGNQAGAAECPALFRKHPGGICTCAHGEAHMVAGVFCRAALACRRDACTCDADTRDGSRPSRLTRSCDDAWHEGGERIETAHGRSTTAARLIRVSPGPTPPPQDKRPLCSSRYALSNSSPCAAAREFNCFFCPKFSPLSLAALTRAGVESQTPAGARRWSVSLPSPPTPLTFPEPDMRSSYLLILQVHKFACLVTEHQPDCCMSLFPLSASLRRSPPAL